MFYGEFEDPDIIRVGDDYYLAGTTMHMNPAVEILHSKDLVNWNLAGYCTNRLDLGPAYRLGGGNIYGDGIWAPCLRHHKGMFYILSNVNGSGLHIFRSKSIRGPWEHNQLPYRHDMAGLLLAFSDRAERFRLARAHIADHLPSEMLRELDISLREVGVRETPLLLKAEALSPGTVEAINFILSKLPDNPDFITVVMDIARALGWQRQDAHPRGPVKYPPHKPE